MKDGVYGEEMPSHIPKPFSIPLLSSVSAICVDQRGYCASFRSASLLDQALPPLPLPYVASKIAFIFLTINPTLLRSTQESKKMSSGGGGDWFQIWAFCPFDSEVALLTESHYLVRSGVRILWSRGKCSVCASPSRVPPGVTPGRNNHVQIRCWREKHTRCHFFCTSFLFFFLLLNCSDSWWKCDRCFNKDVLSLFWRQPSVPVLLCHAWCDWTSHSLVTG